MDRSPSLAPRTGRSRVGRPSRIVPGALALLVSLGVPGALVVAPAVGAASPCSVKNLATNATKANLQAAINAAAPGVTLRISGTCTGSFTVGKSLVLVKGAGTATLKGAGGSTLTVTGGSVTLKGLHITGGSGGDHPAFCSGNTCGGGIYHEGGTLELVGTTVSGNSVGTSHGRRAGVVASIMPAASYG